MDKVYLWLTRHRQNNQEGVQQTSACCYSPQADTSFFPTKLFLDSTSCIARSCVRREMNANTCSPCMLLMSNFSCWPSENLTSRDAWEPGFTICAQGAPVGNQGLIQRRRTWAAGAQLLKHWQIAHCRFASDTPG